jgi:hypothetical protein
VMSLDPNGLVRQMRLFELPQQSEGLSPEELSRAVRPRESDRI